MQSLRKGVPQSLKAPVMYYVVLMSPVHRCFDTYFWRLFITFLAILNRKMCCKVQIGRLKWFLIVSSQTKYSYYNDARSPKQCFFFSSLAPAFYTVVRISAHTKYLSHQKWGYLFCWDKGGLFSLINVSFPFCFAVFQRCLPENVQAPAPNLQFYRFIYKLCRQQDGWCQAVWCRTRASKEKPKAGSHGLADIYTRSSCWKKRSYASSKGLSAIHDFSLALSLASAKWVRGHL